jgi:nucleoside-diphosphate-sugar epimerase
VLLTGATGFIGSHVLEALVDAGFRVAALVRNAAPTGRARSPNGPLQPTGMFAQTTAVSVPQSREPCLDSEIRIGDLRDPASLRAALAGCSLVVHTAALARDWGRYQDFYDTNVTGTLNLLRACHAQNIRDVIITGSISSYGEEDSDEVKDEQSPTCSHHPYFLDSIFPSALNYYRDTKRLGTEEAIKFARASNLNLTVIEPAWTFGERETGTGFYAYVKAVQSGMRWVPGSPTNWFHVVYAGDLAQAYVLACQKRPAGIEKYIVGYPEPHLMATVFGLFCREAGLKPPRLLPKWALYPFAFGMEAACTLLRTRNPPPLTRGRLCTFYDSIRYSTRKARAVLGFECRHPLELAVRRTVAWYQANHYL